jgi:hypothetical protein
MKKDSHMMHEDHGHIHHHLKAEHHRHGGRLHHESHMHHSSSPYEHETERPHIPMKGKNEHMMSVDDFKGDAMDTAYGQAGEAGCHADMKKIHSQFKNYGWDSNTGY